MRPMICACALVALLLGGCGSGGPTTPSARPTPRPSPPATATASASPAPDVQQVDVVSAGVGAFDLVAVPVAILHSQAVRSMANGVVVHFSTTRRGARLDSLTSEAVVLYPGQTLVVTANCTDTCDGADGVTQTVTVASWAPADGTPIAVDAATYACGGACKGHGYGDVMALVHGDGLPKDAPIDIFAVCTTAAATIVGGGQRSLIWPQSGGTVTLDVPVILSAQPSSCQVNASPASSSPTS